MIINYGNNDEVKIELYLEIVDKIASLIQIVMIDLKIINNRICSRSIIWHGM
jgi:hypothetical protein